MRVKIFILLASILIGVFFISGVQGAFSSGNQSHLISKVYGPNANITGWVNISFSNEPGDSVLHVSFSGNETKTISLQDFVSKSPSYTHSCNPLDCKKGYSSDNGETTKTFSLASISSRETGIVLTGNIISVDSVQFDIQSDAGPSCGNQLKVDLFSDGKTDFLNDKVGSVACPSLKNYGCFNPSASTEEYILNAGKTYCQRVNLSESPGFQIGAWMRKVSGNSNVTADLRETDGTSVSSCAISGSTITSVGSEVSCDMNYAATEEGEYYACFYLSGSVGEYIIKGDRNPQKVCGLSKMIPGQETAAYQMFVQGKEFGSFGTLNIQNTLSNGEKLSVKIYDYLVKKYGIANGKINCSSTEGCVVPINVSSSSGIDQSVTFSNLLVRYQKEQGFVEENKFYSLTASAPGISSGFQRLFLDGADFSVPQKLGNYTFRFKLGSNQIISETIEVKNVPIIKSLKPVSTASAIPTKFEVTAEAPKGTSIISYIWDFGNGTAPEVTTENKVIHTYHSIGNYSVKVTATDTKSLSSSETFLIEVFSPASWINTTLREMNKNLDRVRAGIQSQSLFDQDSLGSILGLENITSEIERLEAEYSTASSVEEYELIASDLIKVEVPERIFLTSKASSPLIPEKSFVEISVVEAVSGSEVGDQDLYRDAVLVWQYENLETTLVLKEFSAEYKSGTRRLASVFELTIEEKNSITEDYYLFIPKFENIGLSIPVREQGNFLYANLGEVPGTLKKVEFYTTEDIRITDISAFISPSISQLSVGSFSPSPEGLSKKTIFLISITLLAVIGLIVYITLQQWYKKKYERYLFPNKNDLYNIIHYIDSAKKRGLHHGKIIESLKKAKWNHEQITYAIKKYEGRRTGMFELPLPGIVKNLENLGNSHQGNADRYHHSRR